MSLVWIVYLIGVLPSISKFLGMLSFFGTIGTLGAGIVFLICSHDSSRWGWETQEMKEDKVATQKTYLWLVFKLVPVAVLMGVISSLIPSEKTMYYMVAAYGTEKLIENPVAKDLASDGVDVLKQLLVKAKKELQEDGSKVTK